MDGVRTAEGGEGVTGAMIRARIWVDVRLAGGLQALLGAPMAAYSGCGERDGGIGHGKRRSRTGLARVCGDVGLAGGSVDGDEPTGIGQLEDPIVHDLISQAQGVALGRYTPSMALGALVSLVSSRLELISGAVLIAVLFHWWLAVGLMSILLFTRAQVRRSVVKAVEVLMGTTPVLRRADYFHDFAFIAEAAKETRVFDLGGWIVDRFRRDWLKAMERVWRERKSATRAAAPWVVATVFFSLLASFVLVGRAAADGEISLTALAIVVQSILGLTSNLFSFGQGEMTLEHGAMSVPAAIEFERKARQYRLTRGDRNPVVHLPPGLRFEGVSFRYPRAETNTLSSLDLEIPSGQSLAIVGENGAGKTTLVKLLCRLYDPTDGRITVDGTELRTFDTAAWRRRIAVLFQDFVRYELSAADNVGFGALERRDLSSLIQAARRAGAEDMVASLPHGWETILSRRYQNGSELSGGQWQRVALARTLCAAEAGADLLVLDEPTASLDVRAEAEFFDTFLELTKGITTILISHRFSTVRQADLICVLNGGQVVEYGTHEELIAAKADYARMYSLQARHFVDEAQVE